MHIAHSVTSVKHVTRAVNMKKICCVAGYQDRVQSGLKGVRRSWWNAEDPDRTRDASISVYATRFNLCVIC